MRRDSLIWDMTHSECLDPLSRVVFLFKYEDCLIWGGFIRVMAHLYDTWLTQCVLMSLAWCFFFSPDIKILSFGAHFPETWLVYTRRDSLAASWFCWSGMVFLRIWELHISGRIFTRLDSFIWDMTHLEHPDFVSLVFLIFWIRELSHLWNIRMRRDSLGSSWFC